MPDLRIDYQALEFTHATLSRLAGWLDNAQPTLAGYDAALGSSTVADAMGTVAGNWTYHRRQLVQKMQDVDSMVSAALAQFKKTDVTLANSQERTH
jgi:hypothetical protein